MAIASWSLTTVERVEAVFGLTAGEHTAAIEFAIDSSSATLEALTARKLKSRDYVDQIFDGTGTHYLLLPEYPVTAVESLEVYDNLNNLISTVLVAELDELKTDNDGTLYLPQFTFVKGVQNVVVSYTAGITDPADLLVLESAVLDLIAMNVPGETRENPALRRQSLGQYNYSYFDLTGNRWPTSIQYVIDRFVRYA